jgi:hypothetical protein
MPRKGDRISKLLLPLAVILFSALSGLVIPLVSNRSQPGARDPWTPPTATALPTVTPTVTPTPTVPVAPTATLGILIVSPTATPSPGPPSPTPEATATVAVLVEVAAVNLNLRAGPATGQAILGNAAPGEQFTVVGRSANGNWLQVCCYREQRVWLSNAYVKLIGSVEGVPVVQ